MRKRTRLVVTATLTVLGVGCARMSMTSIPAPEIRGRTFRNVLVVADISDLRLRMTMEDHFRSPSEDGCAASVRQQGFVSAQRDSAVTACLGGRLRFRSAHEVFFPGRDYSEDEVVAALRQYGIDATLVITPGASGSTEGFVPPNYSTTCTGFSLTTGCTPTQSSGIVFLSRQWAQFSVKLYDATNGMVVWVAIATSGGNGFAQSADLLRSMADETLERLRADGVLEVR